VDQHGLVATVRIEMGPSGVRLQKFRGPGHDE
jgi:hypothetical protein